MAIRTEWRWLAGVGSALALMLTLASTALMQVEPAPRASDGRSLADQSAETQATFIAVWGDQAASRWVTEHEAELARLAVQSPPTQAPTVTLISAPPTLTPPPAVTGDTALPGEAIPTVAPTATRSPGQTSLPTPTSLGGVTGAASPTAVPTLQTPGTIRTPLVQASPTGIR